MASPHAELMAIARSDDRYAFEAYEFLCHALSYTQDEVLGSEAAEAEETDEVRHVSVDQLMNGVRKFALQQFGLMTPTVFRQWGVGSTSDLVVMISRMIEAGLWHKSPHDVIDAAQPDLKFDEGIVRDYELNLDDW